MARQSSTSRAEQKALMQLSPFELKDKLIELATESEHESEVQLLNAGAGIRTGSAPHPGRPSLPCCASAWSKRASVSLSRPGRTPEKPGIAARFNAFPRDQSRFPGAPLLRDSFDYGVNTLGLDPDRCARADGRHYWVYVSVPDRMLRCTERIVHAYLVQELCAGKPPSRPF